MINLLFTIYDTKANLHEMPFCAPTESAGERMFADAVADPSSRVGRHPEDYQLSVLGAFDTDSGTITVFDDRKVLGTGVKYASDG